MEPRFILRPAVINDIPSIMEIEQICFDLDSFSKRQFAYLISQAKGYFYVAEYQQRVGGYFSALINQRACSLRIYSIAIHPDFAGGSYVFVQKYIHDMDAWNALSVEEQEKVIGRRKFNDVELSDEEKPANAHNAVANIGDDLKIVRANMPFANTAKREYVTYFIGYASTFSTTRQMLESMFIGNPVGNTDRLLDFSTAITGTLFFAPSYDFLGEE